jgi:hypothetical protein
VNLKRYEESMKSKVDNEELFRMRSIEKKTLAEIGKIYSISKVAVFKGLKPFLLKLALTKERTSAPRTKQAMLSVKTWYLTMGPCPGKVNEWLTG